MKAVRGRCCGDGHPAAGCGVATGKGNRYAVCWRRHQPRAKRPDSARTRRSVLLGSGTLVTSPCIGPYTGLTGLSHA